jgi:diaminohydroxyphosphoribosylaminopyrimidine deaminase/5-amino-6-(5-phosphoribosylamino)uracil reductase
MQHALHLAAQGIGEVAPNPAVGCVIYNQYQQLIGLGRTARGGRPHAETQALAMAGAAARGATAFVTLEPCAHHGQTPPCAEALIQAGIAEVHIGCTDPDPRVAGKGIAMLEAAGIRVVLAEGETAAAAHWVNRGFFSRLRRHRPWVTLKIATTADGFIADANGHSQWITGEAARRYGHLLRSRNDAILTGIGTVLADDPSLNCRLAGLEHRSPLRVVLDRNGRMPATAKMLQDTSIIPLPPAGGVRGGCHKSLHPHPSPPPQEGEGVTEVLVLASATLAEALETLAARGVNHLMVEAGSMLTSAFLQQDLVDDLYWFIAPHKRFLNGLPAFTGWQPPTALPQQRLELGQDRLDYWQLSPVISPQKCNLQM